MATKFKYPWFALHVELGKEESVRAEINRQCRIKGIPGLRKFLIPMQPELEMKDGKRVTVDRKCFPGYVLLQLDEYTDDLHHLIKGVKGVYGLLPTHERPSALENEEAALMMLRERERKKGPKPVVIRLKEGDEVTVTKGMFAKLPGTVVSVTGDPTAPVVKVRVKILGRDVETEISYFHVKES